ncbi:hypothetical protein ITP53_18670 [Nonomuraea sp. K274]|uniref:Uncharacterized protein n=1 Tax=Nonomuraea cypriaca TaxID=1187855 RepID=A0A931AAP7_9ACTN|nr:hypothetical protein [Nonomuraea cypriaca]MBF8187719.1 hypothetical protein [Nonomuraea cypriaca]
MSAMHPAHPANVRYDLYGLPSGNPYSTQPLDPLTRETDHERLLELEGFVHLPAIKKAVERAVGAEGPAFFLINGVGNSGRTSLANHVMYLYKLARAAHPAPCMLLTHSPEAGEMTHDAYKTLRSTLLWLRNKMRQCHVAIPPDLADMFAELSRRPRESPLDDYDLQGIAEYAAGTLADAGHKICFGIRYEGVATKELITQSTKVFENTSTLVVFTVDDYRHADTVQLTETDRQEFAKRGHIVDLPTLTPTQIAALAEHRWTGRPPVPFDPQAVREVFNGRPYTIGEALHHLRVLLDVRLSEYDRDDPWPNEDLSIRGKWLRLKMWQGERWYGTRGFDA